MKRPRWFIKSAGALILSIAFVSCADDQGQDGELLDEELGQQEGYDEQGGEQGAEQGAEGEEDYGNQGENYGNQGENYGNQGENGYNQAGGEQGNYGENELAEGNQADFAGNEGLENNTLSNAYQNPVGNGEALNNSTQDDYAAEEAADVEMAATDDTMTQEIPEEAPMEEQAPPTYMPGEIPPGWARTQNGLFINLSDLTDAPVGYLEQTPVWQ